MLLQISATGREWRGSGTDEPTTPLPHFLGVRRSVRVNEMMLCRNAGNRAAFVGGSKMPGAVIPRVSPSHLQHGLGVGRLRRLVAGFTLKPLLDGYKGIGFGHSIAEISV